MSLRPNKIPKTAEDLLEAAFETELRKEIKPMAWEINERINRLDSQEKDGEPPKRDMYGKSAWDYTMIKYKITIGDLKDDLAGQVKLLRPLFNGLGPSVLDQKEEADRLKLKIQGEVIQTNGSKEESSKEEFKKGK